MEPSIRMYAMPLPKKGETFVVEGKTFRVEHVLYPQGHGGWKIVVVARDASTNELWLFGYSQGHISEPLVYSPGLP